MISKVRRSTVCLALFLCCLLGSISMASAQCVIQGTNVAEANPDDPALGAWKYTIILTWDTGSAHGLSHLDWLFGWADHECVCDDFYEAIAFSDTTGFSTGFDGTNDCTVQVKTRY